MNDTERLPLPPQLPESDILIEIFGRITDLSDELNDPDGLLSNRLAAVEQKADERHDQQMIILKHILNEVMAIKGRLFDAEENIRTLDAHGYLNGSGHVGVQ